MGIFSENQNGNQSINKKSHVQKSVEILDLIVEKGKVREYQSNRLMNASPQKPIYSTKPAYIITI